MNMALPRLTVFFFFGGGGGRGGGGGLSSPSLLYSGNLCVKWRS